LSAGYTTSLPPEYTRLFGYEELHGALIQHRVDRSGVAPGVMMMIPEGDMNFDVAMKQALALRARVGFVCDTADQALTVSNGPGGRCRNTCLSA
jgi:hypothetical protein